MSDHYPSGFAAIPKQIGSVLGDKPRTISDELNQALDQLDRLEAILNRISSALRGPSPESDAVDCPPCSMSDAARRLRVRATNLAEYAANLADDL